MWKAICAIALLLTVAGCGGHSNQANGTPTPTPTPASALSVCAQDGSGACNNPAVVAFGGTAQFTATSNTGTLPALNWSVNGVQGGSSATGTISANGLYTAPTNFDSGKTVTISATSQSNSSISGSGSAVVENNSSKQTPPVVMGTTGGNSTDLVNNGKTITCCSGTLGSLVQIGTNFYVLSNNHVLDKSGQGTVGDPVGQPGLIDNNCSAGTTVANLTAASTIKPNPCTGSPCSGPAPSNADAAIAVVVPATVDTTGKILDLGAVNGAGIDPAPPSATLADLNTALASNAQVAKVGRSSGLTCSTLQATEASVSVQYNSSCGGSVAFTALFTNQVMVNGGSFSAAGDSGSLIVTAANAQPVALLFAGNSTSTAGNSIGDVLKVPAFTIGGNAPTMVGGADHPVSCSAVASSGIATVSANSATLGPREQARVAAVRQRRAAGLMLDPAVQSVEIGGSQDSPGEGALVVRVSDLSAPSVPAVIDGVRTRVFSGAGEANAPSPLLSRADIENAKAIKEAHVADLMSQPGIQGVGVGRSDDNPAETAIVIYVIQGVSHPPIPATIDGVRTKIIEGDRFRAFGWGKEPKQPDSGKCVKR